jgi:hypothetical protein
MSDVIDVGASGRPGSGHGDRPAVGGSRFDRLLLVASVSDTANALSDRCKTARCSAELTAYVWRVMDRQTRGAVGV